MATNLVLAKSGTLATYILLLRTEHRSSRCPGRCVTIQANPYLGGDHQINAKRR